MPETVLLFVVLAVLIGGFWYLARTLRPREKDEGDESLLLIQNQFQNNIETLARKFSEELRDLRNVIGLNVKDMRDTSEKSTGTLHAEVKDFTRNIAEMKSALEKVHESVRSSSEKMISFGDLFRTPQLRGSAGELSLEYILKGRYPEELVLKQYPLHHGKERVDFALKLPNNSILPIDSKDFTKTASEIATAINDDERLAKRRALIQSVKGEIDAIAEKYICPDEGTTDFALMFIPAEAVYYEIMFNLSDSAIVEYAEKKHVIPTSPNNLYLHLNVVERWLRDVSIQKETHELIRRLGTIKMDSKKLDESFGKLGKHLSSAQSSFEDSKKRLSFLTERVEKVIKIGGDNNETSPLNQPTIDISTKTEDEGALL